MKADFRKVRVAMSTDTNAIPAKIRKKVADFNYQNNTTIEIKEFCGNWDGAQFNSAILYIHKDFVEKFKSEYPELF